MLAHAAAQVAPRWLLVAGLLVAITLAWLWLRVSWPHPRLGDDEASRLGPAWTAPIARAGVAVLAAAGLVVWALTLTAALFADTPDLVDNLAPFVVNLQLLVAGMLAAAVLGDWWRAAGPFATLARLVPEPAQVRTAPAWTGPVSLAAFLWLVVCYHDNGDPVAIGLWLLAHTAFTLAGAVRWGGDWVRTGEGFGQLLGACARMAPLHRDPTSGRLAWRAPLAGLRGSALPPGTEVTVLLAASAAAYEVIARTTWWSAEVVGTREGWSRTAVATIGVAFAAGSAAVVLQAATRRLAPSPAPAALVPLATGIAVAMLLTDALMRSVDVLALLSDPYGKGWDLLGTADWYPDVRWSSSRRLAWTELGALLAGALASVVVAHDAALAAAPGRAAAERALLPQLAAGSVLAVAALLLLLG